MINEDALTQNPIAGSATCLDKDRPTTSHALWRHQHQNPNAQASPPCGGSASGRALEINSNADPFMADRKSVFVTVNIFKVAEKTHSA
jgi:hypothetical protein